jgi:gamma-tubulin complex component 2
VRFVDCRSSLAQFQTPVQKPANVRVEEAMVMNELLFVLMGCEGSHVRVSESYDPTDERDRLKGPEFKITKSFDPSIKDLTMSIVQIASWYMALSGFVDHQSTSRHGRVNQALCASIRLILKDYLLMVSQLEHEVLNNPDYTLQNMSVQLIPMSNVLRHTYEAAQRILDANAEAELAAMNPVNMDDIIERIKDSKSYDFESTRTYKDFGICKGGSVLKLLSMRLEKYSGDPTAQSVLKRLLRHASKPYLKMFEQWIHKGVIDDPYSEFMIKESKTIPMEELHRDYADQYWEKRYTIRKDDLPLQFAIPEIYEKVLLTGKYLNVIRECGGPDVSTDINESYNSIDDDRIILNLGTAYKHANQSLLRLLVETHSLTARLRSLKHYFLLDRADYFISFLDIAQEELVKPSRKVSVTKLQYLMDMALRQPGSISSEDPFKDEVIVSMSHTSVTEYLLKITSVIGVNAEEVRQISSDGSDFVRNMVMAARRTAEPAPTVDIDKRSKNFTAIMGLQLDFKIPFPLSLALSRNSIMRYQFLFRHLVELKNIERGLNGSWVEAMKSGAWRRHSSIPRVNAWKLEAIRLRSTMLLFIQQLLYYCTVDVIEPNWTKLENNLRNAKTVDILMKQHIVYLDTCIKECMLTSPKLLKIQAKLFRACRMFGDFLPDQKSTLLQIDPSAVTDVEMATFARAVKSNGENYTTEELMDYLDKAIGQYRSSFNRYILEFLAEINISGATYSNVLLNLSARLEGYLQGIEPP